jgi:tetratricopeptide (TPR) repeat protein
MADKPSGSDKTLDGSGTQCDDPGATFVGDAPPEPESQGNDSPSQAIATGMFTSAGDVPPARAPEQGGAPSDTIATGVFTVAEPPSSRPAGPQQPARVDAVPPAAARPGDGHAGAMSSRGQASPDQSVEALAPEGATGVWGDTMEPAGTQTEGPPVSRGFAATVGGLPADFPAEGAATQAIGATGMYTPSEARGPATEAFGATGVYMPQQAGGPATEAFGATGVYTPGQGKGLATEAAGATGDFGSTLPAGTEFDQRQAVRARVPADAAMCGRYVLKRFHARGGMGEIWMAEDPFIGRSVALKRMLGRRPDQIQRFEVEAQVTGQLEHPGIVPVHELGFNQEGQPFYVMKFVQGRTLQKVIEEFHAAKKKGTRKEDQEVEQMRMLQIFISLCQTVAYAHSRGVLHRDLKPENVMLGPYGETILLDWGIAKVKGQPDGVPVTEGGESTYVRLTDTDPDSGTMAGAVMGTPSYMAPEVAAGKTDLVDEQSDIYLLGGTLYEILTNCQPRKGKTALEMVKLAQREPPVPPSKIVPDLPKALDAICRKAMAHQKEDRYKTTKALIDDLQRFVAGEPVSAYTETFAERAWRWAKRHRKVLMRSAAAIAFVTVSAVAVKAFRDSELARMAAQREVALAKERDQARLDLKEFQRLADEARYLAANTDPITEAAVYFDPKEGERTGQAALAIAAKWGPTCDQLPLTEEREPLRRNLADLRLVLANLKSDAAGPNASIERLELPMPSGRIRALTRDAATMVALVQQNLDNANQAENHQKAGGSQNRLTSLDHFFRGEAFRKASHYRGDDPGKLKDSKPDTTQMNKAIDEYRSALRLDPQHYWSQFQLGRCLIALNRSDEAIEALGACVALRPDAAWAYSARGIALLQQKKFDQAEKDLDRAVALSTDSRTALLNRGALHLATKNYDKALADLNAVLQPPKEKQLVEAALYRAQVYLNRPNADVDAAVADLDRVISEIPAQREAYRYRAEIHFSRGQRDQGMKDVDNYASLALRAPSDEWEMHGRRGRLLRWWHAELPLQQRSRPRGMRLANLAREEMLEAVKKGGAAPGLFEDLGAIDEHLGKPAEAMQAYDVGLSRSPNDVKLRLLRGWVLDGRGDHAKALADFAVAAKVEPTNAEAHTGLGYESALMKQSVEAQREADSALLHANDKYMVFHNVACIYAVLSQAGDRNAQADQALAVALLQRAVKVWKSGELGPNEIELIKGDPTFAPLRGRNDFQELIKDGSVSLEPPRLDGIRLRRVRLSESPDAA